MQRLVGWLVVCLFVDLLQPLLLLGCCCHVGDIADGAFGLGQLQSFFFLFFQYIKYRSRSNTLLLGVIKYSYSYYGSGSFIVGVCVCRHDTHVIKLLLFSHDFLLFYIGVYFIFVLATTKRGWGAEPIKEKKNILLGNTHTHTTSLSTSHIHSSPPSRQLQKQQQQGKHIPCCRQKKE